MGINHNILSNAEKNEGVESNETNDTASDATLDSALKNATLDVSEKTEIKNKAGNPSNYTSSNNLKKQ